MKTWQGRLEDLGQAPPADLVLVHAPREQFGAAVAQIRKAMPKTPVAGCSGAGEIAGRTVVDDVVVTAIRLEKGKAVVAAVHLHEGESSQEAGRRIVAALPQKGLAHVLVYSDGLLINGTQLVQGMAAALPKHVAVTGGMAGDGDRFQETWVAADDDVGTGMVAVVGLYGPIRVGYGSLGGWDAFGPRRIVTRSKGNVVYELDGQPALDIYKKYLGEHAAGLPATGLLFPLFLPDEGAGVVRTILAVDEGANSLTYAGDVPQGAQAQFMKANFDRLVDGAHGAAMATQASGGGAELALLVSCVGRRLVLKQRVEDELDAVQEVLGPQALMAGFYSYGEICPAAPGADCQLHNQTMTITTLSED